MRVRIMFEGTHNITQTVWIYVLRYQHVAFLKLYKIYVEIIYLFICFKSM